MDPIAPANSTASALEQRLLEAARNDLIPSALSARMAEGLGVHAAGVALQSGVQTSTHAGVSASGKVAAPLFAKPAMWGALALAGAIGVAGFQLSRPADGGGHGTLPPRAALQAAVQASTVATSAARAVAAAPTTATATANAPEVMLAAPQPSPESVPVQSAAAEAVRPTPTAARTSAASDDSGLRAEVALLDRARNALRDGASARAMRLLDRHQQRFARPTLAPEAAALRIEALLQRDQGEQADALSQRFSASYPSHPLRARIEALRGRGTALPASEAAPAP